MIRRSLADESACGDLSASAAGGAEVAAAGRDPPPGSLRAGRPAGPPLAVWPAVPVLLRGGVALFCPSVL